MLKRFFCGLVAVAAGLTVSACDNSSYNDTGYNYPGYDSNYFYDNTYNPPPPPVPNRYLYLADNGGDNIQAFSVGNDGLINNILPGAPFAAGAGGPFSLVTTPNHSYVYAANSAQGGGISGYRVASSGTLTALSGSPFSSPLGTSALAVTPNGELLFSANASANNLPGSITANVINADGSLTAVAPSTTTVSPPGSVTVSPDGRFLYAGLANGQINAYAITSSATLNSLGAIQTSGALRGPLSIAPDGQHLYATLSNGGGVIYSITGSGSLTQVGNFATGSDPGGVAFTPNGQYAYVPNGVGNTVSAFRVNVDGSLSLIQTVSDPDAFAATVSSDGLYLYVSGDVPSLTTFQILSDGTLSQLGAAQNFGTSANSSDESLLYLTR